VVSVSIAASVTFKYVSVLVRFYWGLYCLFCVNTVVADDRQLLQC
jgi:hypothetical protein